MSSVKEKPMKRKLFGTSEHDDKTDTNSASAEKKRRRKNAVPEVPKHYPKSERQQLALVLQMTSVENSPEPATSPPPSIRKTPGGSSRKDKIHKRNQRGETLLHLYTIRGDLDSMKELIRQGADVNVQDFAGWTPLHEACNHGHQEITQYLLQVGANVNSKGLDDDTPLHDAVTNAHRDLVELLLKHGANPLLKNKRGERPLDIAEDQVIRQLMQKEVILSDEESGSEHDCPSPSRSEDSLGSRKKIGKDRTTSTSSSTFQDLYKRKKKKPETDPEDTESYSFLTSDSSEDSDTSEDSSITPINSHSGSSRSNGCSKTPSISASLHKSQKLKKKRKYSDKSDKEPHKVKINPGKSAFAEVTSSSDVSSDSDQSIQRKDKNGTHSESDGYRKCSKNERKDHTKQKSLYAGNKSDDKNTKQSESAYKKQLSMDQVKRARSSSRDTDSSYSKSKIKSSKLLDNKLKSNTENATPKVNGFLSFADSSSDQKKVDTDESIYDFSPSTEDFTNSSGISLKQKKDKSSELFDMLCLGKPSKDLEPDTKKQLTMEQREPILSKSIRKQSKDKDKSLSHSSVQNEDYILDKNHNKISEDSNKVSKTAPTFTNGLPGHNHIPGKVEKYGDRFGEGSAKVPVSVKPDAKVEEIKLEKKIKKHHNSLTSPKKPPQSNGPTAIIKSDTTVKKEIVKSEFSADVKSEKPKKSSSERETKTQSTEKNSSSSVKKKKKHKHKHSHDTPSGEHKHRQRVTSSDRLSTDKLTSSEKDKSGSVQNKTSLKKVDSSKSLQGTSSRKNSHEGRASESGVIPAAKKKVRSTDSTSSEASSKGTKHSSVTKTPKPLLSGSSQEKQSTPASVKKDKSEAKKIALMSDANCSFLSELEQSSRLKLEKEKKMKLQRKKKLLEQQQRLKARSIAETVSKEAKVSTPTTEKQQPSFLEKPPLESADFVEASKQPLRLHALSVDQHTGQVEANFQYHNDFGDPYNENTNSLDRHEFSHAMFQSPPLAARSTSQMDQRSPYTQLPENWNRVDRPPYMLPHEKKHIPVQRSLSFTGQPPPKLPPGVQPRPPEAKSIPMHYHDGIRHRHSVGEGPHHKVPNYPVTPTNIPQPHPVNGPLLPPANRLPPHSYVPIAHPVTHKPEPYPAGPSMTMPGPSGGSVTSTAASLPSNVPISSPLVAKVPIHPVVAAPPTGSTSSISPETSSEPKPDQGSADKKIEPIDSAKEVSLETIKADNETANTKSDPDDTEVTKETINEKEKTQEENAENLVDKEELELKLAREKYIAERLSKLEAVIEEPIPKKLPVFIPMEKLKKAAEKDPVQDRLNVYEEWATIQKQINDRRKKYYTAVVIPQAPHCYCDYMTYTGAYLLSSSRESWLSVPPPSLGEEMRALFVEHEKERVKLRLQHATQREKLIVACEQEIMRVHSRAARMLQNQQIPLSACSVLLDREIYNLERRTKKVPEDNNGRTSIRDRFNGRMRMSWLQDVNDKYVKTKNVLLARQRHESQALHAVQRTEWFLKLQEVENQGQQKRWTNSKPEDVSELYVPLVNISDDFDLLPG